MLCVTSTVRTLFSIDVNPFFFFSMRYSDPDSAGDRPVEVVPLEGELPVEVNSDLVFISIGYKSTPSQMGHHHNIPFDLHKGVVPNIKGAVLNANTQSNDTIIINTTTTHPNHNNLFIGTYVSGWLKRGPTGTIVTTWQDAQETAHTIIHHIMQQQIPITPPDDNLQNLDTLLAKKGVEVVDWSKWKVLNQIELEKGKLHNKSRLKFCTTSEMLDTLKQ